MKKYAWLLTLVALSVLVCSSLALAQEKEYETQKSVKSEKQIVIKLPEGMDKMMPGCQMMGQAGQMGQMGQSPACMMMGPMAGCGMMGQMQCCGMSLAGCCGMGGRGMGMAGCAMGSGGGGMAGRGAAMGGCGMAGSSPRMSWIQKGSGPGCGMGSMGAGPGMGCGMMGGNRGGAGCGMMCGQMGQGMGGGMGKHGCASGYLNCAEALKLTEKQKAELKAICSAAKKAMIRKHADIRVAQTELNEIMSDDVLDFAKAKAKIAEISDLKASVQTDRLNNIQKAQKVLTADQLKQCRAMCMGSCGAAGPQVKKCITIMKGAGGMEMGDDEEDEDVEEEDN
jgi:Spy/CpxP family protein refolding chaperone